MQHERIGRHSQLDQSSCDEQTALHPVLKAVFEALDLAEVSWCLMRRPSSLSAPRGDVDLLIDPVDNVRTRRIMRKLGFGTLRQWGRPDPEAFYLLYHPPTDLNLCLHVSTELTFGPGHYMRTGTAAGCLQRRRKRGALFEPHPKDAFWILLLHCLLDKGNVAFRYQSNLRRLAVSAQADDELAQVAESLCLTGWEAAKMIDRVRSGDWPMLNRLARHLKKYEVRWQPLDRILQSTATSVAILSSRSVRRYAWEKGRSLVRHYVKNPNGTPAEAPALAAHHQDLTLPLQNRQFFRSILGGLRKTESPRASSGHGVTVALLGPDGVGKSTLAANLADSLPDFDSVRTLYMGLGYAGLPRLARLPIPGSLAIVGLLTLWWRYLVARYHRRRGRLVAFDRYTYDAWLSPGRRLTGSQRLARAVWAHACPPPDLVLLLDAPGKVVYDRRGESEPALLEAARQDFLSLRRLIPYLQVVDASRPEEVVRNDVANRVRRYARRNGVHH